MCSNDSADERILRVTVSSNNLTTLRVQRDRHPVSPDGECSASTLQFSESRAQTTPTTTTTTGHTTLRTAELESHSFVPYPQPTAAAAALTIHPIRRIGPPITMSSILGGNGVVPPSILPPLDHYRLQLYNYAMVERLRCSQYSAAGNGSASSGGPLQFNSPGYSSAAAAAAAAAAVTAGGNPYGPSRFALSMSLFHNRVFQPEEPKPQHSYIGLIAMAILSSPECKLVLSDIYQHILDNYPYFRTRGPGWRNSIRHNLSLNDCFIKAGRSANGKGHYWAIHPANLEDFKKGDFRRRKAQRKVRKHMGLAVDDESADSPSPPPLAVTPPTSAVMSQSPHGGGPASHSGLVLGATQSPNSAFCAQSWAAAAAHAQAAQAAQAAAAAAAAAAAQHAISNSVVYSQTTRKRQFDVASLLAPDHDDSDTGNRNSPTTTSQRHSGYQQYLRQQLNYTNTPTPPLPPPVSNQTSPQLLKGFTIKRISLPCPPIIAGATSDIEEDIDVVANDAENNNNNTNANQNALDNDDPAASFLLSYSDECLIGETHHHHQKDAISDADTTPPPSSQIVDSPATTPPLHYDQRPQSGGPHHTELSSNPAGVDHESAGNTINSESSTPTACSNSSVARAAAAAAAVSWHGLMQQWPNNFQQHLTVGTGSPAMDPRILQRYYGQYMAAAAAQQAATIAAVANTRRNNHINTDSAMNSEIATAYHHQQSVVKQQSPLDETTSLTYSSATSDC